MKEVFCPHAVPPQVVMDDEERQMVADAADAVYEAPAYEEAVAPAPQAMVVVEDTEDDKPIKIVKNYVRPVRSHTTATLHMGTSHGQYLNISYFVRLLMLYVYCICFNCICFLLYLCLHLAQAHKGAPKGFDPSKMVVSPITGELIALSDMEEHMRVSLIDPRWREQKEAMISKIRDTTRAADDEIARNLVGLAKTRPDIFGACVGTVVWRGSVVNRWHCVFQWAFSTP